MEQAKLEQIIEQARLDGRTRLNLGSKQIYTLPSSIGSLFNLRHLELRDNQITTLPDSIANLSNLTILDLGGNGIINVPEQIFSLTNLTVLGLHCNSLIALPDSIGNLYNLTRLTLLDNQLTKLPDSIGELCNLVELLAQDNQLTNLPDSINKLHKLKDLDLDNNQLISLPKNMSDLSSLNHLHLNNNHLTALPGSICNLVNLGSLEINGNQLIDLSSLQYLVGLYYVGYFEVELPRRYWTKFSQWKAEWLLDENNAEIRRILIEQLGYEKICQEVGAFTLDNWREYTLLKIDGVEAIYNDRQRNPIEREPMVLLKMTCPSTQHIHILRVPPEMVSAEAAITWVNHGIHPDEFAVQT